MNTKTLLLATALTMASAAAFADDRPGPDWMPLDRAYKALADAGYSDVVSIEADDGRWEAEAFRDGAKIKLTVDPRTGTVTATPKRMR